MDFELSDEQKSVVNRCLEFHKHGNEHNVLVVSAGAGTGKSTVIKRLWDLIPKEDDAVLCATTNEASKIIEGSTVHSMFGMRVGQEGFPEDRSEILGNGYTTIIDEMSQLQQIVLDTLRRDSSMKIILIGDPNQLTVQGIPDIDDFEHITLTHNFRASNKEISELVKALDQAVSDCEMLRMKDYYCDSIRPVYSHKDFLEECKLGDEILVTAYTNRAVNKYKEYLHNNSKAKILTAHKAQGKSYKKVCIDLANMFSEYRRKPNPYQPPPLELEQLLRLISVACSRAMDEIVLFIGDGRKWN